MPFSSQSSWSLEPLSERSITVRFIQHPHYLEAVVHGFVNPAAAKAALYKIAQESRRTGAKRVLVDTGLLIGQLTKSDHATIGEHVATQFADGARIAGIAPVRHPVGEIAPAARREGADYLGFRTRREALDWLFAV